MGNKDKDKDKESHSKEGVMEGATGSTRDARQATWDLSQERATSVEKLVADAVARRTAELTVTFTAILNERVTTSMPTSLKVTSGATGISAMPPFDWTKDKAIYQ